MSGVSSEAFRHIREEELAEIERRRKLYLGGRPRVEVAGRTAIVVDDGIATGTTTRAALRATRMRNPKRLILAVPVALSGAADAMREEADEVICLEEPDFFGAIGFHYGDFSQIEDQEVIDLMARFPEKVPSE